MIGGGRIVGGGLMIGSAGLMMVFAVWLLSEETVTSAGARSLGLLLALLVLGPIFGIGFYLLRKGTAEKEQFAHVEQEKKILNMVLAQGQVTMADLVMELELPRDDIEDMIRDLVGKQLFSGAINWEKGILYSVESQALVDGQTCPNCGSQVEFAGKGLIACPYCGSQVFLTKRAAAETAAVAADL
jgi:DNA-directed RNA polymerase subunit RPC12/RpoP